MIEVSLQLTAPEARMLRDCTDLSDTAFGDIAYDMCDDGTGDWSDVLDSLVMKIQETAEPLEDYEF